MTAQRAAAVTRVSRANVVTSAKRWLGTPYRHQASTLGAGCDCLGLVRGVWREISGFEPEIPPPYRADWAETGLDETLLAAARRHLIERAKAPLLTGDVILFRMAAGACVKHAAIVTDVAGPTPRMIHAYWGRAVVESWLGAWWRARLAAVFEFPAVIETPDERV